MVYNPCPRKTTVIVNKIFGIERAWINRGSEDRRPRQIYITKSPLLAEKVEEDYVGLWLSLGTGPDIPEYVTEHIQRWNSRKKLNLFVADRAVGDRDDLPKRYNELQDNHFPLFITTEEVSTTISESKKKLIAVMIFISAVMYPLRGGLGIIEKDAVENSRTCCDSRRLQAGILATSPSRSNERR
jgi:hypothetical protein